MHIKHGVKILRLQSFFSILMIVLLSLGFCPVRNTLYGIFESSPVKTTPNAPEHARVVAADHCGSVAEISSVHLIEQRYHQPSFLFLAILIGAFFISAFLIPARLFCYASITENGQACIPIYLRNKVLRI
ncbi:MAG: hypothetical protein JO080_06360 [Mucilaginibacter sp.]|nr:hypothetical protein [Mucilaginibacter sp.]